MTTLGECPPGLFLYKDRCLGFKSEYRTESKSRPGFWQSDAYVLETGEYFWGGTSNPVERERLIVEPIEPDDLEGNDDNLRAYNEALQKALAAR